MSAHLGAHYDDSVSQAQMAMILDLCNNQVDELTFGKEECLICGQELSLAALQSHLATHMEDLALFVLPNDDEGQHTEETNDSIKAAKRGSKGKFSDSGSSLSSLGFPAAEDDGQTPADFSRLLRSIEAGYGSKIIQWQTTENLVPGSMIALLEHLDDGDDEVRHRALEDLLSQPGLPNEILDAIMAKLQSLVRDWPLALRWAICGQNEVAVRRLIDIGADVNSPDDVFGTLLKRAVKTQHESIVLLLLDNGADVNAQGNSSGTALHEAVMAGHEGIIILLLEHGADISARDLAGYTPLHKAATNGSEVAVRRLVDAGADIESNESRNRTPLHLAAEAGCELLIGILKDYGADVNSCDDSGMTPLLLAALAGHQGTVERLLESGADQQARDIEGRTPLSLAMENGNQSIIQLLQSKLDQSETVQLFEVTHASSDDAEATADWGLDDLDFDSVHPLYKKSAMDWNAVFNPSIERVLDVDFVHSLEQGRGARCVTFSHDGRFLATVRNDVAKIFYVESGEELCSLNHEASSIVCNRTLVSVCFSPDGRYLVTGTMNGVINVSRYHAPYSGC